MTDELVLIAISLAALVMAIHSLRITRHARADANRLERRLDSLFDILRKRTW